MNTNYFLSIFLSFSGQNISKYPKNKKHLLKTVSYQLASIFLFYPHKPAEQVIFKQFDQQIFH